MGCVVEKDVINQSEELKQKIILSMFKFQKLSTINSHYREYTSFCEQNHCTIDKTITSLLQSRLKEFSDEKLLVEQTILDFYQNYPGLLSFYLKTRGNPPDCNQISRLIRSYKKRMV